MSKIEFGHLEIGEVARQHIQQCLDNNWVTMGPKVKLLEKKWRHLFNYDYATMVNSGTSADLAACIALYEYGAKPGDEVIVPALSFIATANAVRAAGFTPVFVDVKLDTMNIDENKIKEAITSKTRAIMSVNLMGKPAALDKIKEICQKHALIHIVDNCEAYGSMLHGKYALHYADFETSSHFTAHLIMSVEGGIVSSNTGYDDYTIKSIRSHGRNPDSQYFEHLRYGLNLKPSDLHACIGLEQIERFWEVFNKRRENVAMIREAVREFGEFAYFTMEDEGAINCPHGFSITLKFGYKEKLHKLKKLLDDTGIAWKRNFGSMPHHHAFDYLNTPKYKFLNSQYIGAYGIHIGCHYYLDAEDLSLICSTLRQFFTEEIHKND
jgi:dTDP-4-amino-4,6-dideoxygalactose transaminase